MDDFYLKYEQKAIKAKEKIAVLENELQEVLNKLKENRNNIKLLHEVKRINIKIAKAVYELKHSQVVLGKPNSLIF